jgi:tetratricopeptide (TPR) repeat protein
MPTRPGKRSEAALGGLLLSLALAAPLLACAGKAPPPSPVAASLREEGLALAPRDDTASLERAASLLEEAARQDPRLYPARADRALVLFLSAAALRDAAARAPDGDALARSGRELREQALDSLRPLVKEHPGDAAVARALAVYYGLDGRLAEAAELAARARAAGGADALLDLAELAAGLAGAPPEAAIPRLAAFAASHPGVLRARMMLARLQLDTGQTDGALATLEEVLAANPDHDRASDLKASLLAPPAARMVVVPSPTDAPPPRAWGTLPRKPARTR